jgi:hypothetical protein
MARLQAASRRFQFEKRSQDFIDVHNETLSVAAMRVNNPDCSLFDGSFPASPMAAGCFNGRTSVALSFSYCAAGHGVDARRKSYRDLLHDLQRRELPRQGDDGRECQRNLHQVRNNYARARAREAFTISAQRRTLADFIGRVMLNCYALASRRSLDDGNGRGGIRTHGGFPHARFRVECLKPDSATLPSGPKENAERPTSNIQY